MRAALPIVCLALLTGCAQLRPPRHVQTYKPTPVTDKKTASQAVQDWRAALGLKKLTKIVDASQGNIAPPFMPTAKTDWLVRAVDDKGENWTFFVSEKTGRVTMVQREVKFNAMTMASRGSGKKYARGEDAMKDISDMCAPLVAGRELTLTSFDMGASYASRSFGSSRTLYLMFGSGMHAHYSVLAHGRPFLTGDYGIDVQIDPASGEIFTYTESLETPATGSPIPLVLPEAAVVTAEKSAGVKAGTFVNATPILGWAVPTGGREARLHYMIDGSQGAISYPPIFVSAETGLVDKGLAAIATAPGRASYFISGLGGAFRAYTSVGTVPPAKAKSAKPKAAPKKP